MEAEPGSAPDDLHFFHTDHLFSTQLLTDDTGAIEESYRYEEFGHSRVADNTFTLKAAWEPSPLGNIYRFTGRPFASTVSPSGVEQWFDHRARHYESSFGIFCARDPLLFSDGSNMYSYARLNPISGRDPMGTLTITHDGPSMSAVDEFLSNSGSHTSGDDHAWGAGCATGGPGGYCIPADAGDGVSKSGCVYYGLVKGLIMGGRGPWQHPTNPGELSNPDPDDPSNCVLNYLDYAFAFCTGNAGPLSDWATGEWWTSFQGGDCIRACLISKFGHSWLESKDCEDFNTKVIHEDHEECYCFCGTIIAGLDLGDMGCQGIPLLDGAGVTFGPN